MRFCALAVTLTLACALGAGCQGDGGAVSVRWRLVDLSTGQAWDANDPKITSDGSCCRADLDPSHSCATSPWVVANVFVNLRDPTTGLSVTRTKPADCSERELTSPFVLPTGTWAITLDTDPADANPPPVTPAPQLRAIVRGAVVNLDVVEIGVDPLPRPLPTPDAGVTP
jgi:hypothetical protein